MTPAEAILWPLRLLFCVHSSFAGLCVSKVTDYKQILCVDWSCSHLLSLPNCPLLLVIRWRGTNLYNIFQTLENSPLFFIHCPEIYKPLATLTLLPPSIFQYVRCGLCHACDIFFMKYETLYKVLRGQFFIWYSHYSCMMQFWLPQPPLEGA